MTELSLRVFSEELALQSKRPIKGTLLSIHLAFHPGAPEDRKQPRTDSPECHPSFARGISDQGPRRLTHHGSHRSDPTGDAKIRCTLRDKDRGNTRFRAHLKRHPLAPA